MDPFSLTAGSIGILGPVLQVCFKVKTLISDVREAPRELETTLHHIEELERTIRLIRDDNNATTRELPRDIAKQMVNVVRNSQDILVKLHALVDNYTPGTGRHFVSVKWVSSGKKEAIALNKQLEVHTRSLAMTVGISTLDVSRSIKSDTTTLLMTSGQIHQETTHLARNAEEILVELRQLKDQVANLDRGVVDGFLQDSQPYMDMEELGYNAGPVVPQFRPAPSQSQNHVLEKYLETLSTYAETAYAESAFGDAFSETSPDDWQSMVGPMSLGERFRSVSPARSPSTSSSRTTIPTIERKPVWPNTMTERILNRDNPYNVVIIGPSKEAKSRLFHQLACLSSQRGKSNSATDLSMASLSRLEDGIFIHDMDVLLPDYVQIVLTEQVTGRKIDLTHPADATNWREYASDHSRERYGVEIDSSGRSSEPLIRFSFFDFDLDGNGLDIGNGGPESHAPAVERLGQLLHTLTSRSLVARLHGVLFVTGDDMGLYKQHSGSGSLVPRHGWAEFISYCRSTLPDIFQNLHVINACHPHSLYQNHDALRNFSTGNNMTGGSMPDMELTPFPLDPDHGREICQHWLASLSHPVHVSHPTSRVSVLAEFLDCITVRNLLKSLIRSTPITTTTHIPMAKTTNMMAVDTKLHQCLEAAVDFWSWEIAKCAETDQSLTAICTEINDWAAELETGNSVEPQRGAAAVHDELIRQLEAYDHDEQVPFYSYSGINLTNDVYLGPFHSACRGLRITAICDFRVELVNPEDWGSIRSYESANLKWKARYTRYFTEDEDGDNEHIATTYASSRVVNAAKIEKLEDFISRVSTLKVQWEGLPEFLERRKEYVRDVQGTIGAGKDSATTEFAGTGGRSIYSSRTAVERGPVSCRELLEKQLPYQKVFNKAEMNRYRKLPSQLAGQDLSQYLMSVGAQNLVQPLGELLFGSPAFTNGTPPLLDTALQLLTQRRKEHEWSWREQPTSQNTPIEPPIQHTPEPPAEEVEETPTPETPPLQDQPIRQDVEQPVEHVQPHASRAWRNFKRAYRES